LFVYGPIDPRWVTAKPNCDDDEINGKRDLEDFTRLHIKVDAFTASLPNVTYWMKYENVTSYSPSINLFEAVDITSNYLMRDDKAEEQLLKGKLRTVGASEVQLLNQYIKPNGTVSPFLLEGKTRGVGDLTIIVKNNGAEIARKSVHLDLRSASGFVQKFVVNTITGDRVQDQAIEVGPCTYAPEELYPSTQGTSEYVLYVHGWNMGEPIHQARRRGLALHPGRQARRDRQVDLHRQAQWD
jgi:hypothetical protein